MIPKLALAFSLMPFFSSISLSQTPPTCDEAGLRAAIQQGGTVALECDGVITLTQPIVISNAVTLDGTGHNVAISGGGKVQIFQVQPNASLTLLGLTIQNGFAPEGGAILNRGSVAATNCNFYSNQSLAIVGVPARGGAILSSGILAIEACTFDANSAISTSSGFSDPTYPSTFGYSGRGGAIYIDSGTASANNSAWIENWAEGANGAPGPGGVGGFAAGGAIFVAAGQVISINNTFASNRVVGAQGGKPYAGGTPGIGGNAVGGAIYVQTATIKIYHNTVAYNFAIPGCGGPLSQYSGISVPYGTGAGAGIYNESGVVSLANSILVGNVINGPVDPSGNGDPYSQFSYAGNYSGPVSDLGFNISSDDTVPVIKSRIDPQLGPLDFYGGATKTFSLLPTSPAIDFSNNRYSPATDERGVSRSSGRTADAGAFEVESQSVPSSDLAALRAQIAAGGKIALTGANYFNVGEPIEIVKDTEIDAAAAIFDGLGGSRIFHVAPGVKFTLVDASVVNGCATNGAGIFNEGSAALMNCRFNGNAAIGVPGAHGGNSSARGGTGGPGSNGNMGRGGAIDNTGSLISSNCMFLENRVVGGHGGDGGRGGPAPTYYLLSNYQGCRSVSPGGAGGLAGVGGIGAGAAIYNSGSASIRNSQFGFNDAIGGEGGKGGDAGIKGCQAFGPNNPAGNGGLGGAATGGAICSPGTLDITSAAFDQDTAKGGRGGNGGASDIYFNTEGLGANGGDASGGGLYIRNSASLTNVAIAKSVAAGGQGGALGLNQYCIGPDHYGTGTGGNATGGAIDASAAATIVNCTLVDNEADGGDGGPTNGYCNFVGLAGTATGSIIKSAGPNTLSLRNSILAGVRDTNAVTGPFSDAGHNIVSGPIPGFTAATTLTNTDPRLIEINLVGSLPFYRPSSDSPARDAVSATEAPATDQRGVLRPVGPAADIGSIELAASEIPPVVTLDTTTLTLHYVGRPSSDYALYTTTDFHTWSAVATNRTDISGQVTFDSIERLLAPWRFFYPAELLP